MASLVLAFLISLLVNLAVVRSARIHAHRSGDHDFSKPQKFHAVAVPRIGGLGIVLGLAVAVGVLVWQAGQGALWIYLLLACSAPAFLAGFVQDLTEAISPKGRLAATAAAAAMAFFLLDAAITRTALPGLDWLVTSLAGSFLLTVFAVAGVANAVNIIDGFNGLASMCVMLMLAALGYVAFQVGDLLLAALAFTCVGAVLGFFIWNFPSGLLFLGDGGAYFLGFMVAEISILLLVRNPGVSPIFPLLVCIYPAFETLFSIYRRLALRQQPAHMPDGIHLHSLVYRRMMRWAVGDRTVKALTRRNSLTSPFLWVLCMASIAPAVLFWDNTPVLLLFLLLFALSYLMLYWRIVRFQSPKLLRRITSRLPPADNGDTRG